MGDSHAPTLLPSWVRGPPSTLGHVLNKPSRTGGSEAPCTLRHHPPLNPASSQPGGYRCRGGLQGAHLGPRARRAGDGPPSHGRVWGTQYWPTPLRGCLWAPPSCGGTGAGRGWRAFCVAGARGANGGRPRSLSVSTTGYAGVACMHSRSVYFSVQLSLAQAAFCLFVCHLS